MLSSFGSFRASFGKSAYKQMTTDSGDRDLGQALYGVKDHVDDLVQSTLTHRKRKPMGTLASNIHFDATRLAHPTVNPRSTGSVFGRRISVYLFAAIDRKGFLFGQNQTPLYQAARFSQAFKPAVGDSGTGTRSINLLDIGSLPLGIPANIASRLYLSRPGGAMLRAPGVLASGVKPLLPPGGARGAATQLIRSRKSACFLRSFSL